MRTLRHHALSKHALCILRFPFGQSFGRARAAFLEHLVERALAGPVYTWEEVCKYLEEEE